jgi:hypothetical protein
MRKLQNASCVVNIFTRKKCQYNKKYNRSGSVFCQKQLRTQTLFLVNVTISDKSGTFRSQIYYALRLRYLILLQQSHMFKGTATIFGNFMEARKLQIHANHYLRLS